MKSVLQAASRANAQNFGASWEFPEDVTHGRADDDDDDEPPHETPQFGKALYDFTAGGDEEVCDIPWEVSITNFYVFC